MKTISYRQRKVYEFIVRFKQAHDGNSPSLIQIGEGCGISSRGVTHYQVGRLVALGMLRYAGDHRDARMIEVIGGRWTPPTSAQFI